MWRNLVAEKVKAKDPEKNKLKDGILISCETLTAGDMQIMSYHVSSMNIKMYPRANEHVFKTMFKSL